MTNSDNSPTVAPAGDHRYTADLAASLEAKWQQYWKDEKTFYAPNPVGELATDQGLPDDKLFVQDMFPYPSGVGLHVGHPLGYIATDVFARFHRMQGKNVLHTLGYDSFGLPAEQYAIQTGTHPRATTEANIANMQRQLSRLGLGHDRAVRWRPQTLSSTSGHSGFSCRSLTPGSIPRKIGSTVSELLELLESGWAPHQGRARLSPAQRRRQRRRRR